LKAFAEREFILSIPDKDGVTYRQALQTLLDRHLRRGDKPERVAELRAELAQPPLPQSLEYLWAAFCRLATRRTSNGYGPNLITYPEIDAFQRVTSIRLDPWEVEIIEMLDRMFITENAKSQGNGGGE
jgi:hypothetical protein